MQGGCIMCPTLIKDNDTKIKGIPNVLGDTFSLLG